MKHTRKALLVIALAGAGIFGVGACAAPAEPVQSEQSPAPPQGQAPKQPEPPKEVAPPKPKANIAISAESVVYAEEMDSSYGLMEDYPTALQVTVENTSDQTLDVYSLEFYAGDDNGNLYSSATMGLYDDQEMAKDGPLPPGKKVTGVVGFSEEFDPTEVMVGDFMTGENVTAEVK